MNHREHGEHHTVIMGAVACLNDADGETIETVIKMVGMTEQLTRQLVMGADPSLIDFMLEEKRVLKADEIKRRMRCVKQDANAILAHLMDDKPLNGLTDWGANIHTHLDNITIACDLNDNESKTWKL
jgi:hypothetical protein